MPRIPMSPGELPNQNFGAVWAAPPIAEGRSIFSINRMRPRGLRVPDRRPQRCTFIAGTEWAWSPMNNRQAAYFLSKTSRKWWLLWEGMLNDNVVPWRWEYYATYGMLAAGVHREAAAWHLLEHSWRMEAKEGGLDRFHMIDSTGELDAAQLESIAERVWDE